MRRFLLISSLVLSAAPVLMAQSASPSPTPTDGRASNTTDAPPVAPEFKANSDALPAAERVGVDVADQLPLTLADAIRFALENNNDIDSSKLVRDIARFNLTSARGGFDPALISDSFYENRSTPTASVIGGARDGLVTLRSIGGSVGIGGLSGFAGGRYNLSLTNSKTNTSNSNATLNPQYPTLLSLSYTQPLLRGRRSDLSRRILEIAKRNVSLTDSQFEQKTIEIISDVEQAYWDLTYALRNLQVQIEALKQARQQLESNQRLVEKGVLAPIETVAANAQISTLEQAVYAAQASVTSAENRLKTLILPDRVNPNWSKAIVPVSPVEAVIPRIPLEEAVKTALESRPEMNQASANEEVAKINENYFREQTRPQVDLTATYSSAGLAGGLTAASVNPVTGQLRVPERFIGGYSTSLGSLVNNEYPTYRVGVTISLPFGNRTAGANYGAALVETRIVRNERDRLEQRIEAEVRDAVQSMKSAEARLKAAGAARASAELLFESEQRQFRNGTTTVFLVFQRQNELVAAKARELQAQTDLNKAISTFQRVLGSTLRVNNVQISK